LVPNYIHCFPGTSDNSKNCYFLYFTLLITHLWY